MSPRAAKATKDRVGAGSAPTRRPGRPRSAEAHERILWAALNQIADAGYHALTMETVAARAKVGKATIYRRWSSKQELLKEAIPLIRPAETPEDQGELVADIAAWVMANRAKVEQTNAAVIIPRLVAESADDPELHAFVTENLIGPIRSVLRSVIERAVKRGELAKSTDVELAVDLLHGTAVYKMLITAGDVGAAVQVMPRVVGVIRAANAP